jgi:hypothetical protein
MRYASAYKSYARDLPGDLHIRPTAIVEGALHALNCESFPHVVVVIWVDGELNIATAKAFTASTIAWSP